MLLRRFVADLRLATTFALLVASHSATALPPPPPIIAAPGTKTGPAIRTGAIDKAEWEARTKVAEACRRALVGQDYDPQPAIWKIGDADTTIYLFGTFHSLPRLFEWRSEQIDRIIKEAQSIITERGLQAGVDLSDPDGLAIKELMGPADPRPIAERVTGERLVKWLGVSAVMPEETVRKIDRLPTWLAAIAIGQAADRGKTPPLTKGVDDQLTDDFKKAGKSISAIEDWASVAAILATIPEDAQLRALNDTLDAVGRRRSPEERMAPFHRWAKGEAPLADADMKMPGELRERLLDARNRRWTNVVKEQLAKPGVTLVAVGAGHLWGNNSLIDLLAGQGLQAERVSATATPRLRPKFLPTPTNWNECNDYQFGRRTPQAQ